MVASLLLIVLKCANIQHKEIISVSYYFIPFVLVQQCSDFTC